MSKEKTTRILKSLCVILVAVGLIALSPMLGFDEGAAFLPEADAAVVWDGTVAGNYYNSGSGTSDSPWIITTPQQLAKLAQVVNNGTLDTSGKYFRLGADLDLNNVSWTPIGTSSNYFKGTFVGIGYTISNLTAGSSLENRGLFGVASGAYLSYITITNVSITNTEGFVGSLCGNFRGGSSARDCHVNGYIFLGNTSPTSQVECIGGMFGRVRDAASISNCSVKVTNQYKKTISGWSWLGGFVGQVYGSGTKSFLNCTVDGLTVIAQHTNANTPPRIGGFFGDMTDGGSSMTCTYKGCAVLNCTIQGAYYIGGFGFALRDNTEVSGCCVSNTSITDNGTMSGSTDNEVGGLFGFVADSTVKIRLCYSLISNFVFRGSSAGYVGAIVGKNEGGSGIYSSSSTSATYGNGNYYLALSAGMTTGDGTSNSGNNISENYLKPVSSVAYFQSGNVASLLNVSRETLSTKMGVDYPYYYTQQNGNFISGIPVPGSSSNATAEAVFWCDDVNIPSGTPQAKHFQTLTFTGIDVTGAYYSSLRREMYINVGQTGAFNAVADPGWDFKIHVTSTSGSAYDYTYALNDYTSFVLDSATYRTSYIVKVELYVKEYTITYKSGTKTINPTGAPTTFSLRSWPSLSGVTSSREYWVFGGWNTAADGTGTAVSQVKTSTLGYNNVTLYADWNLEQQTGTDGKVYRIIYTFEHLEEFSRLIRTSPSANAKLCSIQISYPQFRVNLKTGEVELTEARASSFVSRPTRELETIRSYAANLSITQQRAFLSMISGMTSEYTEYNYQWKPANYTYSGIFDGCGNTISGVRYGGAAALSNEKYGLFATLGSTGVIKNINFTGGSMIITSSLTGNTIWAGLAVGNALSGSQIINCVSSVPIDVSGTGTSGNKYVGGLVGSGICTIEKCSTSGSFAADAATGYFGGIIGSGSSGSMIKNCFSSSVISSSSTSYSTYIAGFAGAFAGSIEDSFFNGTITRSRNGSALVYSEGFNTTVTNSYYIDTVFATAGKSTSMSAERMKSGELCWLLQNGQPDTTVLVWGQSSLTSYPKFYTSENWRVRKVECGDTPYYNIGKVLGDTNGDFTVNSVDLTRFMKASVGFGYADGGLSELTVGDLNSDGTIDAIDAAMLEMAISGGTDYKLQ